MSEEPQVNPSPNETQENNVADELRSLGRNLVSLLQSALNSEESQKIQKEIVEGLNEAGACVQKAADDFSLSSTGQQFKSDLNDLNQRMESGELQAKVRADVLTAIQTANAEIKKASDKFRTPPTDTGQDTPKGL